MWRKARKSAGSTNILRLAIFPCLQIFSYISWSAWFASRFFFSNEVMKPSPKGSPEQITPWQGVQRYGSFMASYNVSILNTKTGSLFTVKDNSRVVWPSAGLRLQSLIKAPTTATVLDVLKWDLLNFSPLSDKRIILSYLISRGRMVLEKKLNRLAHIFRFGTSVLFG